MSGPIELHVDGIEEIERDFRGGFVPRVKNGLSKAVRRSVDDGMRKARARVPVSPFQKPHLRDSIVARVLGANVSEAGEFTVTGEITAGGRAFPYTVMVEGGTKAHVIRPKVARVLAWENPGSQGDWRFARVVNHPGTRAHPFMGPAFFETEQRLGAEVERLVEDACEKFNQD